jgi:GNAT superfamily N-acetyltransferase
MDLFTQDYADIQEHVTYAKEMFRAHGLTLESSGDMEDFARFIAAQKESWGASASHDPLHSYLTPANAFWIWLQDKDGNRVASAAQKVIRTESFIDEVLSHRLYDTMKPVLDARLPEFFAGVGDGDFNFRGNVVYGSGLFVHPDYRGRGFILLGRVSRTLALRHFSADWFVGIQRYTPNSHMRALKAQSYAHCKPALKGMPYKWDGQFQISWSSGAEWLDAIRSELRDAGRIPAMPSHAPADRRPEEAAGHNPARTH